MKRWRIRGFATVLLTVAPLVLGSCGGQHNQTIPTTQSALSPNSKSVGVVAQSQAELLDRIAVAHQAGLAPKYITVAANGNSYVFPVYAQIAKSQNALIVLAYDKLFIFRADSSSVSYSGRPMDSSQLPTVAMKSTDNIIAKGAAPGTFRYGDLDLKRAICADCVALVAQKSNVAILTASWHGIQDPWQTSPDYVAWAPTPIHPYVLGCPPGMYPLLARVKKAAGPHMHRDLCIAPSTPISDPIPVSGPSLSGGSSGYGCVRRIGGRCIRNTNSWCPCQVAQVPNSSAGLNFQSGHFWPRLSTQIGSTLSQVEDAIQADLTTRLLANPSMYLANPQQIFDVRLSNDPTGSVTLEYRTYYVSNTGNSAVGPYINIGTVFVKSRP